MANNFFPVNGGGGSGIIKGEVTTYSSLPVAADHAGEIYVVTQSTGVWLINRKDAGLYRCNGVTWSRLGDIPSYFDDAHFQVYNNADTTKAIDFNVANVSTGTTRTITFPDENIEAGKDKNAIHKNVDSEIHSITGKTELVDNDVFVIEDSADSYNKKSVTLDNLSKSIFGFEILTEDGLPILTEAGDPLLVE